MWNKGLKGLHLSPATEFKKGIVPWNKNKKFPGVSGAKSNFWKGGITSKNILDRSRFTQTVSKKVMKRDDYTCQMCGERGGCLHVDHLKSWSKYKNLRFEENNCRTLCRGCHYETTFGREISVDNNWGFIPIHRKENHV